MSRGSELAKRFLQSHDQLYDEDNIPEGDSHLWNRFRKVRDALFSSLNPQNTAGIQKKFNSFSWTGEDEGIQDHNGNIQGIINGITVDLQIKGISFTQHSEFVPDAKGKIRRECSKVHHIKVKGRFISPDGMQGAVICAYKNKTTKTKSITTVEYEAYWLQTSDGNLRLEQVVNPEGKVFDTEEIDPQNEEIYIPGIERKIPRLWEK